MQNLFLALALFAALWAGSWGSNPKSDALCAVDSRGCPDSSGVSEQADGRGSVDPWGVANE